MKTRVKKNILEKQITAVNWAPWIKLWSFPSFFLVVYIPPQACVRKVLEYVAEQVSGIEQTLSGLLIIPWDFNRKT